MSDHPDSDPWWGGESPVDTDRRFDDLPPVSGPSRDRFDDLPPAPGPSRDRFDDLPPVSGPSRDRLDDVPPAPGPSRDRFDDLPPVSGPSRDRLDDVPPAPTRSRAQVFVPAPEDLPPLDEFGDPIVEAPPVPVAPPADVPDAPVLSPPAPAPPPVPSPSGDRPRRPPRSEPTPPRARPIDRRRLAVVYDVDGPRVRLGLAWFAGAMVAAALSPFTAAVVFAVAAGLAARQIVRAWGSVPWQADVATGLGAVPVLAALLGTPAVVVAVVLALVVAAGAAAAPDGARLAGGEGRVAAAGILALSLVPAVAGAAFVLVRVESVVAATVLVLLASAYEMGDFVVGSGASNPIEGPLAGVTTATLVSLPLALVLVEPYDAAGVGLLAFTAVACPFGQVVASAALPGAGAPAPALRRIDTLLVLAPIWAAAAGAV